MHLLCTRAATLPKNEYRKNVKFYRVFIKLQVLYRFFIHKYRFFYRFFPNPKNIGFYRFLPKIYAFSLVLQKNTVFSAFVNKKHGFKSCTFNTSNKKIIYAYKHGGQGIFLLIQYFKYGYAFRAKVLSNLYVSLGLSLLSP